MAQGKVTSAWFLKDIKYIVTLRLISVGQSIGHIQFRFDPSKYFRGSRTLVTMSIVSTCATNIELTTHCWHVLPDEQLSVEYI